MSVGFANSTSACHAYLGRHKDGVAESGGCVGVSRVPIDGDVVARAVVGQGVETAVNITPWLVVEMVDVHDRVFAESDEALLDDSRNDPHSCVLCTDEGDVGDRITIHL